MDSQILRHSRCLEQDHPEWSMEPVGMVKVGQHPVWLSVVHDEPNGMLMGFYYEGRDSSSGYDSCVDAVAAANKRNEPSQQLNLSEELAACAELFSRASQDSLVKKFS